MARNDAVLIRLSEAEKKSFRDASKLAGIGLSAWARERLRLAAIRELEAAGRPILFLLSKGDRDAGKD
jgi:hypothetical protein